MAPAGYLVAAEPFRARQCDCGVFGAGDIYEIGKFAVPADAPECWPNVITLDGDARKATRDVQRVLRRVLISGGGPGRH
jgi:hypothetical protein